MTASDMPSFLGHLLQVSLHGPVTSWKGTHYPKGSWGVKSNRPTAPP